MENKETINYQDFEKLEIKIGRIVSAERVPEADKLLKLMVDVGELGERQIMAGIAEFVSEPASLAGKQVPILVNLEPRRLRGYESQGMMLAASPESGPILLHPATDVPPGSVVK
jgi:methionine--tRNA ligase beta chain